MQNIFDLSGRVAIVTGGTGVLGSAMALGLAQAGVKVGILGRTAATGTKKVEEFKSKGFDAIGLNADVLIESELEGARVEILNQWGRVDILVNCAGGNRNGATIGPDENIFDLWGILSIFTSIVHMVEVT